MYHWCKAGDNTELDLVAQNLTSYVLYICALIFYHSTGFFFAYITNCSGLLLSLLLSGTAVVLLIRITFRRIDWAILKLAHSCLKNIVVGNMLSRKLTIFIFTDNISHIFSRWRRTPSPLKYSQRGRRQEEEAQHLRTPCSRVKTFFLVLFF